tara:strand:- start:316 stop:942 length:627 start_codon:yes stop_codon:yes gene_type:complete
MRQFYQSWISTCQRAAELSAQQLPDVKLRFALGAKRVPYLLGLKENRPPRTKTSALVVAPKGEEASEQAEEESNASAAPALVDMSLELQLQELREWRSGKRRRVEGVDVEAGGAFSLVTTSETTAAGSSSSSSNRGGTSMTAQLSDKLIKVKKEAAEGEEDADKLVSQQHRFIDFMQGKIDELKELALAGGTPQKHRVAEIVNRTWHE